SEAPASERVQEVLPSPLSADDRKAEALRILRPQVKQMLGIVPNAMAVRFQDKRLALNPEELEGGTDAYCNALDALFPELEKLVKILAVLGVVIWTGGIVLSRVVMVQAIAKERAQAAARRAREEGEGHADRRSDGEAEDDGLPGDDDGADPRFL
ncbi:hypothetical protein LCGC14_2250950, partial [marine sediment metagenome]